MSNLDHEITVAQMAAGMDLTEDNLMRRLAVVGFQPEDLARIESLRAFVEDNVEALTSAFFGFLESLPEARELLSNGPLVDRARRLKTEHLRAMVRGNYDQEYGLQRLKLAKIYSVGNLSPHVFLGAFHHLLKNIGTSLIREAGRDPIEHFENFMALKKVAFLDIGIIIDAIVFERERLIGLKDIELERNEANLKTSKMMESRLRAAIEKSSSIISMRDANGELLYANQAVEKIFGFSMVDSGSFSFEKIIHKSDLPIIREAFSSVVPGQCTRVPRVRARTKDGRWIWLEGMVCNFLGEDSVGATLAMFDEVTDRVQMEENLAHSIKMESFGKLAAGIAHDFNNLTMIINAYGEEIYRVHRDNEDTRKLIEPIVHAAQRASTLTRQLLAFSRKQVMQPQQVDFNSILESSGKMLRRVLGEDIEVEISLAPQLDSVFIDPTQLEQVIMNLALNARDAMPKGGKLSISAANVSLDEEYIAGHGDGQPGPHVMLAITDNGLGIDPSTQSKIFDPFFTTKGIGKGTGLGLSMVQGIVKQSGGNIWVYSEVGMGTTFKLYFPRSKDFKNKSAEATQKHAPNGSETILLIDDEKSIRDVIKLMLTHGGYKVLDFSDPQEVIETCRKNDMKIDLLLTDVVMPNMDGIRLAEQVGSIRPEIKVIYMSGYTDDAIARHGMLSPGASFIEKPIGREELLGKIRFFLGHEAE